MKKSIFIMLLVVMLSMLGVMPLMAAPGFNPNYSVSGVDGAVSQTDAASTTSSYNKNNDPSQAGASGIQTTSASFKGFAVSPSGEDASGSAETSGGIVVTSFSKKDSAGALAIGNTEGNSSINVSTNSGDFTFATLSGSGSLSLGTFATIGTGNLDTWTNQLSTGSNGAFATSSSSGDFNYKAISGPGGYTGWTGSGSIVGASGSNVNIIPGGFSATSSASATSISCPVGK